VVALLLVTALGLSGLLAWQAFDATRTHETVAYKTVKEQAYFAAWEYSGQARSLSTSKILTPGLDVVARWGGKSMDGPLRYPGESADAREIGWDYMESAGAFFRYDLATGEFVTSGPADPGLETWLEQNLRAHLDLGLTDGWSPVLAADPDGQGAIAYRIYPEGWDEAELVLGFRVVPDGLGVPLGYAFTGSPLVPESLTGDKGTEEFFSVSVFDPSGRTVWESETWYDSDFVARDTIGTAFGGLVAEVRVNPATVDHLVIGGLPRSRVPDILILLGLTVGLVVAALYQLRRDVELAQMRGDFVSGVSHELRTPLAQIRMFAETLLLGRVRSEEERQRSLEIIVNEARRLSHQVDNVLLYSRSEKDGVKMDPTPTDLSGLVDDVAEAFEPLAATARSHLEVARNGPMVARVDGPLIRQALLNLLDNAVKYGPSGQTISLGVEHMESMDRARLYVEDQGPGIPEDQRSRIWEPYFRLAAHRESAVAGSGIGLSVVRQVARAHGADLGVEKGSSGGARFVLDVPLMPAAARN
jgi:signal transduction histidine kinase